MKIWEIIPDILYSVQYDNQEDDEYNRIFEELQDFQTVLSFFNAHNLKINDTIMKKPQEFLELIRRHMPIK